MRNIIRKILEFITKIIPPFIIIIAIICIIKFHPKFLTITDFLGITNKKEDVSNLISYIELFIEFGFLYFVLKEFKMTRKSFEWQKKEQEEKKDKEIEEKIKYFAWLVITDFINRYKDWLDKHKEKELYSILRYNEKILDPYCKDRAEQYFLPVSFCKTILTSLIKRSTKQLSESGNIDFFAIYDDFIKLSNKIVFTPYFIKNLNKYFKSYREIEEIYDKLMQDKTI